MFYKLSLIMSSPILSGPWLNMGLIREKGKFQARQKNGDSTGELRLPTYGLSKLMGFFL